jgi:dTDP-4-dehydrorhamnose reductase
MSASKKFLIFGNGQVGNACATRLGKQAVVVRRDDCDFLTATKADFNQIIAHHQPLAIINAAAYTAVDMAENEGRDAAFRINAEAVGMLAEAAASLDIPLVHYSTDYVFDGSGCAPWKETDAPNPQNSYGKSKLAGEQAVQKSGGKYLLFRISWVYDHTGKNFLNTMLRLGVEREELKVVADQFGAPCYAGDIATATLNALSAAEEMPQFPSGVYHMCNQGETSWHGFAEAIFQAVAPHTKLKVQRVLPIHTSEYPTPAKRPLNSRMNCEKLRTTFNLALPHWQDALTRCVAQKYAS